MPDTSGGQPVYEVEIPVVFSVNGAREPGIGRAVVHMLHVRWMPEGGHVDPIVARSFGNHALLNRFPDRAKIGLTLRSLAAPSSSYSGESLQLPALLAMYAVRADQQRGSHELTRMLRDSNVSATGSLGDNGEIEAVEAIKVKCDAILRGVDAGESALFLVPKKCETDLAVDRDAAGVSSGPFEIESNGSRARIVPVSTLNDSLQEVFGETWSLRPNSTNRRRAAGTLGATFLLTALVGLFAYFGTRTIDRVQRRDDHHIAAVNAFGYTLWKYTVKGRLDPADHHIVLDGPDGEQLVIVLVRHENEYPGNLTLLDHRGQELWSRHMSEGYMYEDVWLDTGQMMYPAIVRVVGLDDDGRPEIIVSGKQETHSAGSLSVFTLEGEPLAIFGNPGHVGRVTVADVNGDGHKDLIVQLFHNLVGLIPHADLEHVVGGMTVYHDGIAILDGKTILGGPTLWKGRAPPFDIGDEVPGRAAAYAVLSEHSNAAKIPVDVRWAWMENNGKDLVIAVSCEDGNSLRMRCGSDLDHCISESESFKVDTGRISLIAIDVSPDGSIAD